jgi:bacteriorhodopsin
MRVRDKALPLTLIAILVVQVFLIVALGLDRMQATHATRWEWFALGALGLAVILLLRALRLTLDMRTRISRLSQIQRLLDY